MAELYKVESQRPVQDVMPGGTFEPAMEISFTSKPSGVPGRVRIPMSAYSADHVNQVLTDQARLLESVQTL
jgi:hypothetical protein